MRSLPWNRSAIIADVRDRIWTYVSTAADYAPRGMLVAAALLKWPESDALHLGELQYLLSDEVGDFISSLPNLVRRLATASAREENWTTERLQGPIHWNRTLSLRAATGMSSLFITAPAHRVYQTAENELLVHVLDSICRAGQSAGWDRDDRAIRRRPVAEVHRRLSEATRWQKSRMFTAVDRVPPTSRSLARVRSGRNAQRYAPVLAAYSKLHSLIEQLDRQAIREAIEQAGLVTADEATLFELFTTFQLIKALQSHGWNLRPFSLFSGHVTTRGSHEDGRHVQLWYQHTPRELAVASQYRQVCHPPR